MTPILTIVRGLPGSGKSSYARKLAAETGAMLIEPDSLLVVCGDLVYSENRRIRIEVTNMCAGRPGHPAGLGRRLADGR